MWRDNKSNECEALTGMTLSAVSCFAAGAGLMYLLDPARGRARRAMIRDKTVSTVGETGTGLRRTGQYLRDSSRGLVAETRARFRHEVASDYKVGARVRSNFGRLVSHPKAVWVTVVDGNVTLCGEVLATEHAAMTEPFAVGAHAVAKARMDKDSVALVVGCGPVGLAVIAALKAQGHGPVIAADFSPRRRAAAERLGADVVLDPATESPHDRWEALGVPKARAAQQMMRMMGKSFGRPVVFECVGAPGVLQGLIEAAPAGAQIVVAGVCMETDRIEPSIAITKEIELTFVFGYSPEEFAATLHQIAEGVIDVSNLVTGRVGLDGVAQAFRDLGDPEAHVKVLVEPGR